MLAAILMDQAATIERNLASIAPCSSVAFTVAAAALGFGIARAFSWPRADTDYSARGVSFAQPEHRQR